MKFSKSGKLQLTTSGDRAIVMTRVFDAPRRLVFDAYTKPEFVRRWLGVLEGWQFEVCDVDLRVGGEYRYLWKGPDGMQMGMRGTFKEIVPPEKLVATEQFDESWYPGGAVSTVTLAEKAGKTTLTLLVEYESEEARAAVLKTPAAEGVESGFDKLEELLATQV